MSATPPDAGRVDRGQLHALVHLALKQGLGRGTDANTGAKGFPLLQVVLSMGALGAMLAFGTRRVVDLPSALVLLFGVVFVIVVLAINPDARDVQERRLEILGSKPIAPPTSLAARALVLLVLSALLAGCLGLAPLIALTFRFPFPWPRAVATYATLLLGSFAVAVLWLAAVMIALRWISVDRVRKTSQLLLLAAVVAVNVAALGWLPGGGGPFSLSDWPLARHLPSTWFALSWIGDPGPGAFARGAGALALLGAASLVASGRVLGRAYANLAEQGEEPAPRPAPSSGAWLLERIARVPVVGRALLPSDVQAVAEAVLTATRREDVSRAKTLAPQVLSLLAFAVAWTGAERLMSVTMLTYLGFSAALDGLQVTRQSGTPAASWIFWAAPGEPRHVVRGLVLALSLRFLVLPVSLLALVLFRMHPPALAAALSLAYLLAARLALRLGLLLWPAFPLSQDQQATQSVLGFVVGFAVTIAFAILQAVLVLLHPVFGVFTLVASAVLLSAMALAAWGLGHGAAARVSRLQYPH
jgi:hypothetical protein